MLDILNTAQIIALADIRIDGGTQPRAALNQDTVKDYAEEIRNGAEFPPVILYFDGAEYWLADGFHRYHAHAAAELDEIYADVRQGTQRDAILHSVGANADHGLRRTNEDKRRAVLRLLEDPEWCKWSNNEIAKRTKTTHPFVGKLRFSLETVTSDEPTERTYTTKHGTVATMNTANIGASTQQPSADQSDGIQTTQHGGGFVAYSDSLQLATEPWNTPKAAISAFASTAQQKHYRALYAKDDETKPATVADIIAMINYVNETADVLTVDTEWIIDYLQSMAKRKNFTTNPGDLHAILKQWRRDTLDRQEEEIRQRRIHAAQTTSTQHEYMAPGDTCPAFPSLPNPASGDDVTQTDPEPSTPGDNTAAQSPYTQIALALADARQSIQWAQDHMPKDQTTSDAAALHTALRKIIAYIADANHLTNRLIKQSE